MLGEADDFEAEALVRRRWRLARALEHVRAVVVEEERRDRDDAVGVRRVAAPGGHGGGEAGDLGAGRGRAVAPLERDRGTREDVGGGGEGFVDDLAKCATGGVDGAQGPFDAFDDLGHRREVLQGRDAAQSAHALHDDIPVRGVARTAADACDAHGQFIGLEGEKGVAERAGALRLARAGGGGGIAVEFRGTCAGAGLVGLAPVTDAMQQDLQVVDRAGQCAAQCLIPRHGLLAEAARGPLDGGGDVGEAGQLRHGGGAAQATRLAKERVRRGALRVGAREEAVELFEALARFEHEEVQQTAAWCRHGLVQWDEKSYGRGAPGVNVGRFFRRPSPHASRVPRPPVPR